MLSHLCTFVFSWVWFCFGVVILFCYSCCNFLFIYLKHQKEGKFKGFGILTGLEQGLP